MGIPISGKHAIEIAAFVVAFERPFSTNAIEALSGLQETLKNELPIFQRINVLEVRLEDGAVVKQNVGSVSGVLLQQFGEDGKQSWGVRVEGNTIVVSCQKYDAWNTIAPKALGFIKAAANIVGDEENPLAVVAHQIVDRFVAPSKDGYKIGDVFNTRSDFLTKHTFSAGCLWHIHQGWFDDATLAPSRTLNVLNLSTNDTPSGLITTIDHTAQYQSGGVQTAKVTDDDWLRSLFDELHIKNKTVLGNLLNAKQRKAIKLL